MGKQTMVDVSLTNVIALFPTLFEPTRRNSTSPPKYSIKVAFRKEEGDNYQKMVDAIEEVMTTNDMTYDNNNVCMKEGAEGNPYEEGYYTVKCTRREISKAGNRNKILIVDRKGVPITDSSLIVSGSIINLDLRLYAYLETGQKGVYGVLWNVQLVSPPLGDQDALGMPPSFTYEHDEDSCFT